VHLRPLRSLKGLEITESSIGNRGLAVLKDLPALEYLYLNTGVTDAGLKQVAQVSSLRWLRLGDGNIWGPGLAELVHLPRLERLCIMTTKPISDRHVKYLEGLTQLKGLTFWGGGDALTDASLASIGKLTHLEELYFIRTGPRFTPAGVAHLKNLENLKTVDFGQTWTGPAGVHYGDRVVRQLAGLPNLESLRRIEYLSFNGMKTLATFPKLKCLHVTLKDRRQGYRGRTGLSHLAGLTSLEELAISSGDALPAADLAHLESLSRLKDLLIFGPSLSDGGLASIGKLKQLERLELLCHVSRRGLNHLNGLSHLQGLSVSAGRPDARTGVAREPVLDLSGLTSMKTLGLSELPMHDDDLAFLQHLPQLENVMIQPTTALTGASLRHLRELPELDRLWISGLSDCTGEDLAHLNDVPKLRRLTVRGDITDAALASLTGPSSLESLNVDTDSPIQEQTVTDLTESHPVIEYIRVHTLTPGQARPAGTPRRTGVTRPRSNRRRRR